MAQYKKITPYIIIAVIAALFGGGLVWGYGSKFLAKSATPQRAEIPQNLVQTPAGQGQVSDARNTPVVRAAQTVGPAVVGITNKAYARDFSNRKVLVEQGTGSGVIFDAKGYIATNFHVVQNAQEISVSLADGRVIDGKVLGTDEATDLAVVKIEADNLPVATFGDSDSLMVGEPAVAIGNPLGLEFQGSVTAGVISALNRSLEIGERKFKLIQTDAAINPGNSGGALANADGVVIGINSAKISVAGVEGIGFAIPVNTARPILQSIIEKGRVIRAYLGIGVLDKNSAAQYGYELNIDKGVYVAKVYQDGPAAKAGIKQGDIILTVAGTETNSVADLRSATDAQAVGSQVEVVVKREGKNATLSVTLEEMPAQQ
ncbi:putative membrane protein [Propionispora sp. 2/2-37]|uniref:S1C family serine protease n=1 Tax=Propionispora sp. 2/2-37 TaxID=1677858 RepID=UPI0006BB9020|nr:trypsin-like peptidase domain-containing protein [Propionispora sp. 2/2-37]CUH97551.1 putative membrane protein [Propionispora sp. 2/2-37]